MTCHSGGTLDIFLEPFGLRPSLLVIGTSPTALALGLLAERTGFDVFAAAPGAAEVLARLEGELPAEEDVLLDLPISAYGGG